MHRYLTQKFNPFVIHILNLNTTKFKKESKYNSMSNTWLPRIVATGQSLREQTDITISCILEKAKHSSVTESWRCVTTA